MKYVEKALKVIEEVEKVIIGKNQCIEKIMQAILAEGHILIEDIPGVGKTSMALAFAKALPEEAACPDVVENLQKRVEHIRKRQQEAKAHRRNVKKGRKT